MGRGPSVCISTQKVSPLILWQPLPIVLTGNVHPSIISPCYIAQAVPKLTGSSHPGTSAFPVAVTTGKCCCAQLVHVTFKSTNRSQNFTVKLVFEAMLQGVPIYFLILLLSPRQFFYKSISGCHLPCHPPSFGGPLSGGSAAGLNILVFSDMAPSWRAW